MSAGNDVLKRQWRRGSLVQGKQRVPCEMWMARHDYTGEWWPVVINGFVRFKQYRHKGETILLLPTTSLGGFELAEENGEVSEEEDQP